MIFGAAALATLVAFPEAADGPDAAREGIDRAVRSLVERQEDDGSWGTKVPSSWLDLDYAASSYHAWQFAAHGLATMALAAVPETPDRRRALERAVSWLVDEPLPTRGSDWDCDHVWGALYGFVAVVDIAKDERFDSAEWRRKLLDRGADLYRVLKRYQADSGGWAYYDDPPFGPVPTWATSFCTALVLPALLDARELGWTVDERVVARAERYIRRCALPGGAYAYDWTPKTRLAGVEHINLIQGSLGRTQVCNWALQRAGVESITEDVIRAGVHAFFDHHGLLDQVRTRPIPHEGFYANAGYFYFFAHYYVALAIGLLPEAERESWHRRLRPHLTKTQWASGATSDFLEASYMVTSSTSYLILALSAGLEPERKERKDG